MEFQGLVAVVAILVSGAIVPQQPAGPAAGDSKEVAHQKLRDLAERIDAVKARHASERQVQELIDEYRAISRTLGGDDPAQLSGSPPAGAGQYSVVSPTCSGTPLTLSFSGSSGPIIPTVNGGTNVFTANVSGTGTFLWDLNLLTTIQHTACGDLDITLTSPAGTSATITTDNGFTLANVFNGTMWDDASVETAEDHVYSNNVAVPLLAPKGRLETFRGENPNGVWTLTIADDTAANTGTLSGWTLQIAPLFSTPTVNTITFSRATPLPIPPGAPLATSGTTIDTMTVSGAQPFLVTARLYTEITHTFNADLDITLTSPSGTVAKVTTDNGGSNDNVFDGTLWDEHSLNVVTDFAYPDLFTVPTMQPEGGFERFHFENPNGVWKLTIVDDLGANFGSLDRWDLEITSIAFPPFSTFLNFAGTSGSLADFTPATPVATLYTSSVAGMGGFLWDLDLHTAITHTFCADLDVKLQSPSGTLVTISTDNGGFNDDVFNGTLWDDDTNDPCTRHVYTNQVTATPLSPEGRLAAFRGENPNGTWTLSITDDATSNSGSLSSWSIDVATLASGPATTASVHSKSPALPIPPGAPATTLGTTVDTMLVGGLGSQIAGVVLFTDITHTFNSDLELTLTSPAGTAVEFSARNGGGFDDVFAGTSWNPDSTNAVTDYTFANLVAAPLLAPEGAFDNFVGEDPNGTWTLTIEDIAAADSGMLHRWELSIDTCARRRPSTARRKSTRSDARHRSVEPEVRAPAAAPASRSPARTSSTTSPVS